MTSSAGPADGSSRRPDGPDLAELADRTGIDDLAGLGTRAEVYAAQRAAEKRLFTAAHGLARRIPSCW